MPKAKSNANSAANLAANLRYVRDRRNVTGAQVPREVGE